MAYPPQHVSPQALKLLHFTISLPRTDHRRQERLDNDSIYHFPSSSEEEEESEVEVEVETESPGFYKSCKWSRDGSSLITHSEDNRLRLFSTSDMKEGLPAPSMIRPKALGPKMRNIVDFLPHQGFSPRMGNGLVLCSEAGNPISYRALGVTTEEDQQDAARTRCRTLGGFNLHGFEVSHKVSPTAMTFMDGGRRFVAGCNDWIALFQTKPASEDPIFYTKLNGRRDVYKPEPGQAKFTYGLNSSEDYHGNVTAIAAPEGTPYLFIGTNTRWLGIHRKRSVRDTEATVDLNRDPRIKGKGISQFLFPPDKTLMYVAERESDQILVFDFNRLWHDNDRAMPNVVRILTGRDAITSQRLSVGMLVKAHVVQQRGGKPRVIFYEDSIWAGSTSGVVRAWYHPHNRGTNDFFIPADMSWQAHADAVSSISFNPNVRKYPHLTATTSGSRNDEARLNSLLYGRNANIMQTHGTGDDTGRNSDCTMKIWKAVEQ